LINNYPNLPGPEPAQEKLILPGYSEQQQYQPGSYTQRVFVHPDQLRPQMPPTSTNPLSKLGALWRADPAYKVLIVATVMVLVAGIIFATFLVNTFAQSSASTPKATIPAKVVSNAPTSTTNRPPTFPTPSGGQGSKQASSQPPASAPVVLPTLTPSNQPTQPTTTQNLQLQITNIPQQVRNNSDVQVTVMTNQPGVSVQLQATFDNSVITNSAGPQQTDANGNVTLNWHVADVSFKQSFVARITAIATAQVSNHFKF
jgi:cytoskeletal protein RodZ